jgi:hypothetical protein
MQLYLTTQILIMLYVPPALTINNSALCVDVLFMLLIIVMINSDYFHKHH